KPPILGCQKSDPAASGSVNPRIACSLRTLSLAMLEPTDTRVLASVLLSNRRRAVLRAVVNDQKLPIGKSLGQDTVDRSGKVPLTVVGGNDYRDQGHTATPYTG